MTRRRNETGAAVYFERSKQNKTECARVLTAIDASPFLGATIKEIAVAINLPDAIVSARLGDLRKTNEVEEALLKRKCRINSKLKKVWVRARESAQQRIEFRRTA